MFKPERVLIAVIFLSSLLISVVFVAMVFDLGLVPEGGFKLGKPEEVSDSFQQTNDAVIESLQNGWQRFRNEGYAFQIDFPQQISKKSVLNQEALNTGMGMRPETPVWEFKVKDERYYQDTNLIEASLIIHVLRGEEEIEGCSEFKARSKSMQDPDAPDSPMVVEINGIPFWKDVVEEGVMGETYKLISYRTVKNEACYELTQLIHARNLGSYEPGTVEAYDQEELVEQLDSVLHTFQFLDVTPSFPKIVYPEPKAIRQPVMKGNDDFVDGLDVSHWQGDINWNKVVNAGYVFTFVKATEGIGWTDVKFHENMREGTAAGGMMGVYHFARPDYGHSAKEEAEYFLSEVGDYLESGYLRPVLDFEVGEEFSKQETTAWVMEWMETVETRAGVEPLIYTGVWRAKNYLGEEVTKYDRWVAYWTCEPEPSFDIPPTGKWADWSFWQYYGPDGCGKNAGYVPGVKKNIDLNIFNGVESGLLEYDAASPLWVSLTSDAYLSPKPYDADITADVNGDTTGPVDYHFWWDCPALESDVAVVEGACGELPTPDAGECLDNENGMRCTGIESEIQIAEHTYQEIGDYTPKVIVERGDAQPAEDRYKITVYNPLRSIILDPSSPGIGFLSEPYRLKVVPLLRTSVEGTLQVEVHDEESGEIIDQECKPVAGDFQGAKTFNFYLSQDEIGVKEYNIWARYRPEGECPIEDSHSDDILKNTLIEWQEPPPTVALERPIGTILPQDGVDDVGDKAVNQSIELVYQVHNPSPSTCINIEDVYTENAVNVDGLTIEPAPPIEVLPEEEATITVSFQIGSIDPFAFDLVLAHDGSNPSPYRITVQGNGIEVPNVLQSLDVTSASPGTTWIGKSFALSAEVGVETAVAGLLQVSVVDQLSGMTADQACQSIAGGVRAEKTMDLSWIESTPGEKDYTVWARFRAGGTCPVDDTQASDLSMPYQVIWQEDPPHLELQRSQGISLPAGSRDQIGEFSFYESVALKYVIRNPSTTSRLKIMGITAENLDNLSGVDISPAKPFELASGAKKSIAVSFLVDNPGAFSFDLNLTHDGSKPSPYRVTVEGSGMMSADPIQSLDISPSSPDTPLIGEMFSLSAEVGVDIPIAGALEVIVVDQATGKIRDEDCQHVVEGLVATRSFKLSWTESAPGERDYEVRALYRAGSGCPLEGAADAESSHSYLIDWGEDTPVLEVQRPQGTTLPSGSVDEIGMYESYQPIKLTYLLHNPSTTSSIRVMKITAQKLNQLSNVEIFPSGPFGVGPGEKKKIDVSFRVENAGPLSFDLALDHDGGNASPYILSVEGSGVMAENLIRFITLDPLSPGSAYIGKTFKLGVEVGFDVPDQGALQVRLMENGSGEIIDEACQSVVDALKGTQKLSLSWSEPSPGAVDYTIQARYQVGGSCPLGDAYDEQRTRDYRVTWQEIAPVLEIQGQNGVVLSSGDSDQVRDTTFGKMQKLVYVIRNTSPTTSMQVQKVGATNPVNLSQLDVAPAGPLTIPPGGEKTITISYQAENPGSYSFDLKLKHDASNPTPYQVSVQGNSVLVENPIQSLTPSLVSPGFAWVGERFTLQVEVVVDAPADSALLVSLIEKESGAVRTGQCMVIEGKGRATGTVELPWTETSPGEKEYAIQARYQVRGECPLGEGQDATLTENIKINWQEEIPVLKVQRPEGVDIVNGTVDYIGIHDWFNFVEITYVLENESRTTSLRVEDIHAQNLFNLKRVKVNPSGPFTLGPREEKTVKITFLVLTVDPYAFDLVFDHNAPDAGPYEFAIHGEANLNRYTTDSKMQTYIKSLIEKGFFLRIPDFILHILEGYLE